MKSDEAIENCIIFVLGTQAGPEGLEEEELITRVELLTPEEEERAQEWARDYRERAARG